MALVSTTDPPAAPADVVDVCDVDVAPDEPVDGWRGERRLRDEIVEFAAKLDEITAAVHKRLADIVAGCSLRELSLLMRATHRSRGVYDAAMAGVVAESTGWIGADGHRHPQTWVAAICHTSEDDASRICGLADLFALIPDAERLVRDGTLGVEQAREIVRLVRNRRICNDGIVASFGSIVDAANLTTADQFRGFISDLRDRLDADGNRGRHGAAAFHRNAHVSTVGEATYVDASLPVLEGEFVKEVFEAFKRAEYRADVAAHRERLGLGHDAPVDPSELERSTSQRAGDAFVAVFRAAANAPLDGNPLEINLDVVIDQPSFEQQLLDLVDPFHEHRGTLTRLLGQLDNEPTVPVDHYADVCVGHTGHTDHGDCDEHHERDRAPFAGVGGRQGGTGEAVDRFAHQTRPLCRLTTGATVSDNAATLALLFGHIRRVIIGADSVIIDAGRRRRCFTDGAKQAAITQAILDGYRGRCTWPGCRNRHLETDHATEWADGGTTSPWNANLLCRFHNLLKTGRGFTARRTQHGWTYHRPDGTPITRP